MPREGRSLARRVARQVGVEDHRDVADEDPPQGRHRDLVAVEREGAGYRRRAEAQDADREGDFAGAVDDLRRPRDRHRRARAGG